MKTIDAKDANMIRLGKRGENLARRVVFTEPAEWRAAYGDGTVQLIAQRYGESTVYPVALDTDGDAVVWHVTAADTALEGYGRCELRYLVDEVVVKSKSYLTYVAKSLTGDEIDPPEPQQGWVDRVLLAGGDAQAAAEAAEAAAKRAEAVDVAGLDTTLTEEGKAADAKAVGEALKNAGAVKTVNGVEPDENGNVEVEVGGDPVQPDWSVNDETANDYIKNRPFGYKKTVWKDLGEVTVTTQVLFPGVNAYSPLGTADNQSLMSNVVSTFAAGNAVTLARVMFDGVEYELPVQDATVVPGFEEVNNIKVYVCGNLSLLKGILYDPALDIADTGEPFGLALTLGFMGTSETEPATHTVAVSAGTIEPVKVPEEYLPFYHAVDKVDLVNGTITTENQVADPDTPFYLSSYGQEAPLDRIPEKLTVVFDGVEYAELQGKRRAHEMVGDFIHFGNEAVEIPNGVGGELDTGEPFLIRLVPNWVEGKTMGLILYTNTPTGQTHSLVVSTIATHDLDIGGNARFGGLVEAQAVILTNPNGVRYSITVNQHGELTAAEVTA